MTPSLVSIIVVSYNREDDLRLSLEAIFASTHTAIEVIVIDNASADGAVKVARSFPVAHLVQNPDNRGFAEANNQGILLAQGKYVALINNDAVIEPDWIARHVVFLEAHPRAAAVGGKAYLWNDQFPVRSRENSYFGHSVMGDDADTPAVKDGSDDVREVLTLSGAAVVLRREAIDDVGPPFLEPIFFTYYEETDFFARALRKGWKLYYQGEPACWHRVRASTQKEPYRYYFYMNRNRVLFTHRHFDDRALRRVLAPFAWKVLKARVASLLRPSKPLSDEERGLVDAWRWFRENTTLLRAHRVRYANDGMPYRDLLRAIQNT